MATPKPFPHASFLRHLELLNNAASGIPEVTVPRPLARILQPSDETDAAPAVAHLIDLLKALKAMQQAAFDTELAANELRRYHKFPKPGPPSPHIVLLRQRQSGARLASVLSKQSFIKAATAFVKVGSLHKPQRVSLEEFAKLWIDTNVPKDLSESADTVPAPESA